jgi:hypothetical protein
LLPPVTTAVLPDNSSSMTSLLVDVAARIGGLDKTSQPGGRFGQATEFR